MKKTLLILAISALTLSLNAYVPMLRTGKSWTYFTIPYSLNGGSTYFTTQYSITNDTIIDGFTYYQSDFTEYLIREDSAASKVYLLDTDENHEYLLYDFTLSVGDSAYVYHPDGCSGYIYVDTVDTVSALDGTPLRRYSYHYDYVELAPDYWKPLRGYCIESCGRSNDILIELRNNPNLIGGESQTLRCVIDADDFVFYKAHFAKADKYLGDDCTGSGEIPSAVESTPSNQISLAYSDNTLTINTENIENVDVFSANGLLVGSYQSQSINISLAPGIYFARIAADGSVSTERFIVK